MRALLWICRIPLWHHSYILVSSFVPVFTVIYPFIIKYILISFYIPSELLSFHSPTHSALSCSAVPAHCCPRRPAPFWKSSALFCLTWFCMCSKAFFDIIEKPADMSLSSCNVISGFYSFFSIKDRELYFLNFFHLHLIFISCQTLSKIPPFLNFIYFPSHFCFPLFQCALFILFLLMYISP